MNWQVTGQRQHTRSGPNNTVQEGYMLTVQTDSGHTDQVFVPMSSYTPDGARQIINDQLAKVAAVDGLTGST